VKGLMHLKAQLNYAIKDSSRPLQIDLAAARKKESDMGPEYLDAR
jgi:hypothetical protein